MLKWYEEKANDAIVISSRVRLARNLYKYPFSLIINDEEAQKLVEEVKGITDLIANTESKPYYSCAINTLAEIDKVAMIERHIVSPNLAQKNQTTGIIISEDESVSIMINEEDHLRIQAISAGLNLNKAYEVANKIDDIINKKFDFAFDERYGYLTSCPTNTGTGMRASCMVFLPALTAADMVPKLIEELSKFGVTIRGTYGEGTRSLGNIYQISNQKTIGVSEAELIDNLNRIVSQIIRHEQKRREYILSVNYDELEEQVYRAYGVLRYSRQLNSEEAMTLLAQLKFGIDSKLIKLEKDINIHQIMMEVQPASLQWKIGRTVGRSTRNKTRAEHIRKSLPDLV